MARFGLTPLPQRLALVVYRDAPDDTYGDAEALAAVGLSPLVWALDSGEECGDGEEVVLLALAAECDVWVVRHGDVWPLAQAPHFSAMCYGTDALITPARTAQEALAVAVAWDAHPMDNADARELQARILDWLAEAGFRDVERMIEDMD